MIPKEEAKKIKNSFSEQGQKSLKRALENFSVDIQKNVDKYNRSSPRINTSEDKIEMEIRNLGNWSFQNEDDYDWQNWDDYNYYKKIFTEWLKARPWFDENIMEGSVNYGEKNWAYFTINIKKDIKPKVDKEVFKKRQQKIHLQQKISKLKESMYRMDKQENRDKIKAQIKELEKKFKSDFNDQNQDMEVDLMPNPEDQINNDFPYEAYNMDGKLVFKHINTGKVIEVDFDISQNLSEGEEDFDKKKLHRQADEDEQKVRDKQKIKELKKSLKGIKKNKSKEEDFENNQNLTTNNINKNIKNKIKKDEETMDINEKETESKDTAEIRDGQYVETQARGDDDEVEKKIKGDPYNETEKFVNKKDMEEIKAFMASIQADLVEYKKDKAVKEETEKKDLIEILKKEPYSLSLDMLKELPLNKLKDKKDTYDELKIVKDFYIESKHLTHENITKEAFDMVPEADYEDPRSAILRQAQSRFKMDIGEARFNTDFGGDLN